MAMAVKENETRSEMAKKLADDEKSNLIPIISLKSWINQTGANTRKEKSIADITSNRVTCNIENFEKKFGTSPNFFVRVPGRYV
jgi:hypothetical protein